MHAGPGHSRPGKSNPTGSRHAEPRAHEDFDELVRGLEIHAGRRLNEPARSTCLAAYESHPVGVKRAAEAALARTNGRNAIGLFIVIIGDGEHELMELGEYEAPRPRGLTPVEMFEQALQDEQNERPRTYREYTWPTCVDCGKLYPPTGDERCPACADVRLAETSADAAAREAEAEARAREESFGPDVGKGDPLDASTIDDPVIQRIVEESLARRATA
jgi:hypothetical protein